MGFSELEKHSLKKLCRSDDQIKDEFQNLNSLYISFKIIFKLIKEILKEQVPSDILDFIRTQGLNAQIRDYAIIPQGLNYRPKKAENITFGNFL